MSTTRITPSKAGPIKWEHFYESGGPLVISYFTDLFYLREAFQLARSCQEVGIDYAIHQVPDLGDWQRNTSYKPTFILQMHERFAMRDLLWLDADARVQSYPELLRSCHSPIAYHTWRGQHANSGTVYLGWNPELRRKILNRWIQICIERPDQTDQVSMEQAVKGSFRHQHMELPVEYCWIYDFDVEADEHSIAPSPNDASPVIEHFQASRFHKMLPKTRS